VVKPFVTHGQCNIPDLWFTFPAAECHLPLAGTKLYCLVTATTRHEQIDHSHYAVTLWPDVEPTTSWSQVQYPTYCATIPPITTFGATKKPKMF